jgi:AraC-like DNA-binding protein
MRYSGLSGSGFHVVLRGSGWLLASHTPPTALRAGDVVLITSGADHALSHTPRALDGLPQAVLNRQQPEPGPADFEFLCGAYRLDQGRVHPYLAAMPDLVVVSPDYSRSPQLRSVVSLLDDEPQDRPGNAVTRAAILDLMLVHTLRQWLEQEDAKGRPAVSDPAIAAVLGAIHDSPQAPWTVTRLSAAAGMSRSAFTRRFTLVVGKPPMAYLIGWRLSCAARLLRETDASLAAIARQVGYATEFAFAGAFRREYGVPPGRFRSANAAPGEETSGG